MYNLTPFTFSSLPDAWDYSARHGHRLPDFQDFPDAVAMAEILT